MPESDVFIYWFDYARPFCGITHDIGSRRQNMNISIKGTHVIVLYGSGATSRFSDLISRWSKMISASQWRTFQFVLVSQDWPELELDENARALVNNQNTVFFHINEDQAPDANSYYDLIIDKVDVGDVCLHLVVDAGEKELSYDWLRTFVQSAMQIESLSTSCLYYLLFGRKNLAAERDEIQSVLAEFPGATFLLGDANEDGGRVLPENRWYAVELAVLLNSAGITRMGRNAAYSLGYSALNANGKELKILRESAACHALREGLEKPITSMTESDLYLRLLPEGVQSLSDIGNWLRNMVRQSERQPASSAMKNARITIRMDMDLSSGDAVQRMKRFADLNYAGSPQIRSEAKDLANRNMYALKETLCHHAIAANLSDRVLMSIATAFRQAASSDPQPAGCTYPPKPFLVRFGKGVEEYTDKCWQAVRRSILGYIEEKNISVFAEEMANAYESLSQWLRTIQGETSGSGRMTAGELLQDIQRELDSDSDGNAIRLKDKYKNYAQALENIQPGIQMLTEGIHEVYYLPSGKIEEKGWRKLVEGAGNNIGKNLPLGFRGDFFQVLVSEFSSKDEREKFFEEYLRNGKRMYMNLSAERSKGESFLLVDSHRMDQWFMSRDIYEVKTDNAENLTMYRLGDLSPSEYLKDTTVYFKGVRASGEGRGNNLFPEWKKEPGKGHDSLQGRLGFSRHDKTTARNSGHRLFDSSGNTAEKRENKEERSFRDSFDTQNNQAPNSDLLRLEPDDKNEYRLSWKWNDSDPTATVEIFQFGERIGRLAVIHVNQFQANGNNMNITTSIMNGKPLPKGKLTVTIRNHRNEPFIEDVQVPGKRDVVRYKLTNTRLQLKPENQSMVEKLLLQNTEPDGTETLYPLYPSSSGSIWLFEGLSINSGKIVPDGGQTEQDIHPVPVD